MALNFSKTKFMKTYSKRKYLLVDSNNISHEGLTIEEINFGEILRLLLDSGGSSVTQNKSHCLILNSKYLINNAIGYAFQKNIFE